MRRFAIALLFASTATARAEVTRYDLGQRLRLMDRAWESATPENRDKALAALKNVVPYFFANKSTEAAGTLDEARFILRGNGEPGPAVRWATSLFVRPASRFVDPADGPLTIHISASYDTKLEIPAGARLWLSTPAPKSGFNRTLADVPIVALPAKFTLPADQVREGDLHITASVVIGEKLLSETQFVWSIVPNLKSRLDAVSAAEKALPAIKSAERLTARSLRSTLDLLHLRSQLETDIPAARLLREAEELNQSVAAYRNYYKADRPGQFWLTLPANDETPVRLFVPEGLRRENPTALVVAMHGLGATENMFFDAYGDGAAVKMCKERGWLLVATRAGGLLDPAPPVGRIVETLSQLYPIDPKRVFILGHSMGSTQTIAAIQANPGKFAAAASLGGGGAVRKPEAVKDLPVFVACGSEDFLLSGARMLTKALQAAGAKVTFKEFPAIEHLVIVQAAMKEMFAFFDNAVK